jgi:hypothetical protein
MGCECVGFLLQLREEMTIRFVDQRVHGVKPQPVEVVVHHPVERVVEEEAAHVLAVGTIEVDGITPRCLVSIGGVRAELVQMVPGGPEVVVHNVEQNADPPRVSRVDEPLQCLRPSVRLVHRVRRDPVVPPTAFAVEGRDGHQLDHVHAEEDEVIEVVDHAVEGAGRAERPDV